MNGANKGRAARAAEIAGRIKEPVKTAIIIILCVLTAFLLYETVLLGQEVLGSPENAPRNWLFDFFNISSGRKTGEDTGEGRGVPEYIMPLRVAVKPGEQRLCAGYDNAALESAYKTLKPYIKEAFTSGGEAEIDAAAWAEAVRQSVAFVEFGGDMPAELLGGTSGYVRSLTLSENGGILRLCYKDGKGKYYTAATMVNAESLKMMITGLAQTRCSFAAEEKPEVYGALSPETLFSQGELPGKLMRSSLLARSFETAEAAGFGSPAVRSYTDKDGTSVFVGDAGTLYVSQDGNVIYAKSKGGDGLRAADYAGAADGVELAAAAAAAYAERLSSGFLGDARYYIRNLESYETGGYKITLGLLVCGVPVEFEGAGMTAGTVTLKDGYIVSAGLRICGFEKTGSPAGLAPFRQAAAAFAAKTPAEGEYIGLVYQESKGAALPGWTVFGSGADR